MARTPTWGTTPRQSIEAEAARRRHAAVIDGCRALVRGGNVDPDLLLALGGPAARRFLDGEPHADDYWLRVWGLRGLLWIWSPVALPELEAALADEHWRVRETALKVTSRHQVDEVLDVVAALQIDPVARVRQQAARALASLGSDRTPGP